MQPNTEPVDQLALRLWTAARKRNWELVRTLMHPNAELQTGVASDQLLNRELAVTATEVAVAADMYDPKLNSFETLDQHTALVAGKALYRHSSDLVEERRTVWLFTFEDDLLVRSHVFHSIPEALDFHRAQNESGTRGSRRRGDTRSSA